jgi:cytochrome b involved in lipid metabolism
MEVFADVTAYILLEHESASWMVEIQFKSPPTKVSHHQYMEMVEAGHDVAVIDDLVVDLTKYHFHHPGGAFVLK